VRDVWSAHPPLIGLPGRIGSLAHQGSHPGPISFYALWPFYRLFGASAWALQAASASLHFVAALLALWIARRRGGIVMVLAVGAALAVLQAAYGGAILTEAWNPYMPVSWWFVFLLAVWSVACDDLPMLPVAVAAGTFCMQTHLPYLGLVGALLAATVVVVVVVAVRRGDHAARMRAAKWIGGSLALGVVLWLPPIAEQFTHNPGNLDVVFTDLRHPNEKLVGVHRGVDLLFLHLNPWRLIANRGLNPAARPITGSIVPGLLFLVAWAVTAVLAWRHRDREPALAWLHAVIAAALVVAAISMVRISGTIWYYLVLWAWGITVLMVFAAIATVVRVVVAPRLSPRDRERGKRAGVVALGAIIVVSTAFFVDEAAYTQVPNVPVTHSVGEVARPTVAYLHRTDPHERGRYLVTWDDPMTLGARGYSLLVELERDGFHTGGSATVSVGIRPHRVFAPDPRTSEVHFVSGGGAIDAWAARPGVRRVGYFDPRSPAQRARFEQLRRDAGTRLAAAGLGRLVAGVDRGNLLATAYNAAVPPEARRDLLRMLSLGLPVAVFVGPSVH
jgi:hypothetical protein